MTIFDAYSQYYNLLYRDKDYGGESSYVADIFEREKCGKKLLDLGCGTAKHAIELVDRGFDILGVELSEQMLARALKAKSSISPASKGRLRLVQGDACTFRAGEFFDIVSALFHVVSYQTTNESLRGFFTTAAAHLRPNATFLFDCWYGPAVLRTLPEPRMKTGQNDDCEVIRFATPRLRPNDNVVEVHYRILVKSVDTGQWAEFREQHDMRYLFLPELQLFASDCGFEKKEATEFLSGKALSLDTWSACIVARRL